MLRRFFTLAIFWLAGQSFADLTVGTMTYPSSTQGISLTADYYYTVGASDLPILATLHGYNGSRFDFLTNTLGMFASNGWLVVNISMRGRDGLLGTRDDSGIEIMDIYDAVIAARLQLPANATNASIYGTSGGGANAFACAAKIPDLFSGYFEQSGVCDYGYDQTNSWYVTAGSTYQSDMRLYIGGSNGASPYTDLFRTRNASEAMGKNLQGGWVWMWHSAGDTSVNVTNFYTATNAFASNPRYTATLDPGSGHNGYGIPNNYAQWSNSWTTNLAWTIPATGSVRVLGYIQTKRFSVWLGNGKNQVADLDYDTTAGTYYFTGLTSGSILASVTQGSLKGFSNFTSTATITLSQPENSGGHSVTSGKATLTGKIDIQ